MNGTYTATVDRIVDGKTAVILVEEASEVIEQFDVSVDRLPESTREEGGVLIARIVDDEIVELTDDAEKTEERRESNKERLNRLSKRLRDRDDS